MPLYRKPKVEAAPAEPTPTLHWAGPFSMSETYDEMAIVTDDGSSYFAVVPSTGIDPSSDNGTHWQPLAVKGAPGAPGTPGADASTTTVSKSEVSLGSRAPGQTAYAYQEVTDVCRRGLVSKFTVTPNGTGKYDLEIRSAASGGGVRYLAAVDADGTYEITIPVYIEGDETNSIWVGVKNKDATNTRTYTLTALRVEKFA